MRRLFSTFARGWPGVGLLLLRAVAGIAVIQHAASALIAGLPTGPAILQIVAGVAGILLITGLWTPLVAAVVTIAELWHAFSWPGEPFVHIVLASIAAALALLGPGAFSVDARLFGWKRINLPDQKS